ncbi:MAG: TIGR04211 family SH3 domain-containing protein [Desulfuromusa sp.]|nr:TIGR04211 family SH3 domain-containing protein [Desulfuromusa sp.]
MKISLRHILISFLFLLLASSAYAETRYISDHLIVTVRSGKGNEFKILETVPTGTPVTILEEGKTYVKVSTPNGTVGYISRHYVSKSLPKKNQIDRLDKEIAVLEQQIATQQQNLQGNQDQANTSKSQIDELSVLLEQTQQQLEKANQNYNTLLDKSENIINLTTENELLIEQNNLLSSELLILREENQNFHRSNMIQWFLAGGGVLFCGWIIGRISRKKQRRF